MGQEWKWTREGKEAQQLCDWASLQRQLYRETFNGCRRKAKESEKARFERLERQGFVWNYEEWHWDRMYLEVMAYQKAEQIRQQQQQVNTTMNENDNDDNARIITMAADAAVDSEDLSVSAEFPYLKCFRMALWIKEQHDLVLEGLRGNMQPMRNTRVQKLGKIDFSFFTNAFLLDYAGKEMEELTLTASPAAPVKEEEEQESPTQVDSARGRVKEDLDAFDKLCFIEQRAREIAFEEAMKKLES
mgnify:CR=1 FL=1